MLGLLITCVVVLPVLALVFCVVRRSKPGPRSKSGVRSRSRGARRSRAKTTRGIRQAMPYVQAVATAASAVAALIQAIRALSPNPVRPSVGQARGLTAAWQACNAVVAALISCDARLT